MNRPRRRVDALSGQMRVAIGIGSVWKEDQKRVSKRKECWHGHNGSKQESKASVCQSCKVETFPCTERGSIIASAVCGASRSSYLYEGSDTHCPINLDSRVVATNNFNIVDSFVVNFYEISHSLQTCNHIKGLGIRSCADSGGRM